MRKKLDIVFLCVFLAVMLIPAVMADFRGGSISETEKRQLSFFPQLKNMDGSINIRQIKLLENWINDNAGFRENCVDIYTRLMVNGLGVSSNDNVMSGKDGWYFYTPDNNIQIGLGKHLADEEILQTIARNQQTISDYYKRKGIEYYLVITPSKASVYTEKVLGGTAPVYTISDQLGDYIRQHTDVNIITVKDAVISAKDKGQTFLKTDTHWTEFGSYAAYNEIMNVFRNDGVISSDPVIAEFGSQTGEHLGEMGMMLGNYELLGTETFAKAVFDVHSAQITEGEYYSVLAGIQQRVNSNYPAIIRRNDAAEQKKLLIYGDSQWEQFRNMPVYFAENFSEVVSMRADIVYSEIDQTVSPDVMIFACSERYIDSKLLAEPPSYMTEEELSENEIMALSERVTDEQETTLWMDYVNGTSLLIPNTLNVTVTDEGVEIIEGWSADTVNGRPFGELYARIGGNMFKCEYGIDRPSVSEYFGNENLRYTGFKLTVPASAFEGADSIEFIGIASDGSFRYQTMTFHVSVDHVNDQTVLGYPVEALENDFNLWVDNCSGAYLNEDRTINIPYGCSEFVLDGWAADTDRGIPFSALYVQTGSGLFKCSYGGDRQSVVDHFGTEDIRYCGFAVRIPTEALNGADHISFIEIAADNSCRYRNIDLGLIFSSPEIDDNSSDITTVSKADVITTAVAGVIMLIFAVFSWRIFRTIR